MPICPVCKKEFSDILSHVRAKHVHVKRQFPCSRCPEFFRTKESLVAHISKAHGPTPTHAHGAVHLATHNIFRSEPPKRLWLCESRTDKGEDATPTREAENETAAPLLSGLEENERRQVSENPDACNS